MAARKLAALTGEIERTLKKVNEGIEEFDNILNKCHSAGTTNLKEKLEGDLKREIKKLQRMREQIKNWISSNEVKNTVPLADARKRIETQMERFKAYEREAKTKAYSKEGLQAQREKAKKDGKGELTNWLQKSIDELKVQIDTLEVQLEEESGGKKKKGNSGSLAIETSLERHNFHIDALEKILRLWQNDEITKDDIENLKDDVDFYIENNSEPDFVENEGIYDELGLDDIQLAVNHDDDDDLGTDSEDDPISDDEPSPPPSRSASQTPSKKAPVRTSMEDERPPAAARVTPVPVAEKPKPEPMPLAPTAAAPKAAQPKAAFVAKKTEPVKVEERRAAVPPSPAKADPPKKSAVAAPSAAEDKREDPRSKQVATSSLSMSGHIEPPVALPSQVAQHQPIGPSPQAQAAAASGIPLPLLSLQSSFNHLPESIDIGRPTHYKPRVPSSVPSYYPTTPASIFENPALYEKLDTDTLFFVFYYQQGTYQQYLAAKELKRQSWRYHKKYLTWFQRHEEPKEITTDYEQGTYVYFDYETGWCQRKKTEFTFQYRYLEDKDLL